MINDAVRRIVGKTLAETEPPTGPFLEVLLRARPSTLVAMGLLQQSRRSLQAILLLAENQLLDASMGLVRTTLENMVTSTWLLEHPDAHFEEFLGDHRRRLVASAGEDSTIQPLLSQFESLMDTWVGNHESKVPRNIKQRASAATSKSMYSIYRHLSGPAHGSIVGSTLQFAAGADDGELEWSDPGAAMDADAHLAFASALVCITAMRVFEEFGEEAADSFRELHQEIMDVWFPDET